ncbi:MULTISPECIES: hypothetical protein [Tsukamurella]|uniref:Uncharacterized protein n=2 Tax=Tsukamurella TaxID=2060 RepID=A0A846X3Y4_9ACTN|nr:MULTISPECIES: hypothetical protein [Tsukamurella]KXP14407.1 hypothetical protein AXK60_00380 [Tsukamurella pseudospumae]NKY19039.1 hypothetical protein [Tsukamurella spumae]
MGWSLIVMPVRDGDMPEFDAGQIDEIMNRFGVVPGPRGLVHGDPESCTYTDISIVSGNAITFDRPGRADDFRLIWELLDSCGAVVFDPGTMASAVSRREVRDAMPLGYPVVPYIATTWQDLITSAWDTDDPA